MTYTNSQLNHIEWLAYFAKVVDPTNICITPTASVKTTHALKPEESYQSSIDIISSANVEMWLDKKLNLMTCHAIQNRFKDIPTVTLLSTPWYSHDDLYVGTYHIISALTVAEVLDKLKRYAACAPFNHITNVIISDNIPRASYSDFSRGPGDEVEDIVEQINNDSLRRKVQCLINDGLGNTVVQLKKDVRAVVPVFQMLLALCYDIGVIDPAAMRFMEPLVLDKLKGTTILYQGKEHRIPQSTLWKIAAMLLSKHQDFI